MAKYVFKKSRVPNEVPIAADVEMDAVMTNDRSGGFGFFDEGFLADDYDDA